jgi:peptidoglycan hydrolase-like protein with peptidoglycan-binding domain
VRHEIVLCAVATLAASPAVALAQAPPVPPPPVPVQAQLRLVVERAGGPLATVLVGSSIRVRGTVDAYVAGESVTVRIYDDARRLRVEHEAIVPAPDGTGLFELSYRAERSGRLVVRASHAPTPALGLLEATSRTIDVIPRSVGRHSRPRAVRALQRRLRRLGYVVGATGSYDARTARAVLAFRKVTGMRRTTDASVAVMRRIARGKGAFTIRRPEDGRHVEADLTRQVIALVDAGRVRRIYPISSGSPGTPTVLGSFHVYKKASGTNAKGMVDSAYFTGGYATHGYPSVPVYPASHGCLRVPLSDALSLFRWIRVGTAVDVYYGPKPR